MKLLLGENLSRCIVLLLQAEYPGSSQVALLQLEAATGRVVLEYERANDFVIVTRDADFYELGTLHGAPPKVIWFKTGNQSKASTLCCFRNKNYTGFMDDTMNQLWSGDRALAPLLRCNSK